MCRPRFKCNPSKCRHNTSFDMTWTWSSLRTFIMQNPYLCSRSSEHQLHKTTYSRQLLHNENLCPLPSPGHSTFPCLHRQKLHVDLMQLVSHISRLLKPRYIGFQKAPSINHCKEEDRWCCKIRVCKDLPTMIQTRTNDILLTVSTPLCQITS